MIKVSKNMMSLHAITQCAVVCRINDLHLFLALTMINAGGYSSCCSGQKLDTEVPWQLSTSSIFTPRNLAEHHRGQWDPIGSDWKHKKVHHHDEALDYSSWEINLLVPAAMKIRQRDSPLSHKWVLFQIFLQDVVVSPWLWPLSPAPSAVSSLLHL